MFHEFVHVCLLACGLMFWVPVLGQDPATRRPRYHRGLAMVAIGVPVYAAIAWGMWAEGQFVSPDHSLSDIHLGAVAMVVGGTALSLAGAAVAMVQELHHRRLVRSRATRRATNVVAAA